METASQVEQPQTKTSFLKIFLIFLRLGLTSFGGPIAHLGYFREEFVAQRRWLSEQRYADLVALCQFLPGPASSQVGLALGLQRGGYAGAAAAWLGFTLPSALALMLFASGIANYSGEMAAGALDGLKIVAVAVVAQAVWGMSRTLCPDRTRITIMLAACCLVTLAPTVWSQVGVIVLAGLLGMGLFKSAQDSAQDNVSMVPQEPRAKHWTAIWLLLFFVLLFGLPMLAQATSSETLTIIDAFYRAGALVFGGGHVVLPLLQAEVVPNGWVSDDTFLAGYGAAQAVPGPLFTFSAFLGVSLNGDTTGWIGGLICLLAIFLPSFLLIAGALPYWERLRGNRHIQAALWGVNAAVVGLLLAALYQPVWTSAINSPEDFTLGLLAFIALMFWKVPPWLVVSASAVIAWGIGTVL